MNEFKPLKLLPTKAQNWDEWLVDIENQLCEKGYSRYDQKLKLENFTYWKTFESEGKKTFMIGILFYDFRDKYDLGSHHNRISVMFECLLHDIEGRIDLTVSKNIRISEFKEMAETFYLSMQKFCKFKEPENE